MHVVQHLSILHLLLHAVLPPPLIVWLYPISLPYPIFYLISHLPAISPAHAALHLHSLAVDRDKVVENDEGHGSYTKTICEVCKCVIRDHFVLIVDSLTISRISGATVQRRNGATAQRCGVSVSRVG